MEKSKEIGIDIATAYAKKVLISKGCSIRTASDQADDIAQNAVLVSLKKGIPLTKGIVFKCCLHNTRDSKRYTQRVRHISAKNENGENEAFDHVDTRSNTIAQAILNETLSQFASDQEKNKVFNLDFQGYKGIEIAEMTGLSPVKVSRILAECREELQKTA